MPALLMTDRLEIRSLTVKAGFDFLCTLDLEKNRGRIKRPVISKIRTSNSLMPAKTTPEMISY